jgi:hypothetical protein
MTIYVGIVLLFSVWLDASTSLEDRTREALMGVLMLKCRTTGREFSTGIYADEETFNRLPDTVAKAACPHCGRVHSWWTREARVSEGDDFPNLIPAAS